MRRRWKLVFDVSSFISTEQNERSFICVYTVLHSDRDPARLSTARPDPKFDYTPNEMKFCTLVDQALVCTLFQDAKMEKSLFKYFFTFSQKLLGSKLPKTAPKHVSWIPVTRAFSSGTLQKSIIIKRDYSRYFTFPCFIQ